MAVEKSSTCKTLTGKDPTKDSTFEVLDKENNNGLKIIYKNGDMCEADNTRVY